MKSIARASLRSLFTRCRDTMCRRAMPVRPRRPRHSLEPLESRIAPATVTTIALDASSDSGVGTQGSTFTDEITNDTTPTFYGTATAGSLVRLFADKNSNGTVEPGTDLLLGEAVALTGDGYWVITSNANLNDPAHFASGGVRKIMATADAGAALTTDIFIDTSGPQVTGVLFDPINPALAELSVFGAQPTSGPTPLTRTVVVNLRDLPAAATGFLDGAVNPIVAATPGQYALTGDVHGPIAISSIIVINNAVSNGNIATARVELNFNTPLPDDRYTLTIRDSIVDDAGNALDGDSNSSEPLDSPSFPTGDGQPGGDFVARFTVDSRPEVGVFSDGVWYVDLNGNGRFDATSGDVANADVAYVFGVAKDLIVTGSWDQNGTAAGGTTTDGFDRIGAYGKRGTTMNFELDLNGNGVFDEDDAMNGGSFAFGKGGMPVAGHWPGAGVGNDDRVGLFKGGSWMVDLNGNHVLDPAETFAKSGFTGTPIAGDWTGTGVDRVGTFSKDTFYLDMNGDFKFDATDEAAGGKIKFSASTKGQAGVVGDWDGDGDTNIGVMVKDRVGLTPAGTAEWYLDNGTPFTGPLGLQMANAFGNFGGGSLTGVPGDGAFQPPPTGGLPTFPNLPAVLQDLFVQFGGTNKVNVAFVGNFDPPTGGAPGVLPLVDHADTAGPNATPVLLPADGGAWHGAGAIGAVKDKDVFQFTPTASGRLMIDAAKFNSGLNTSLSVFLDGKRIALNDNFGRSTDSHLALDVLAGHTYFIQVAGSRGTAGAYDLLVDFEVSAAPAPLARSGLVWPANLAAL